MCWKAAISYLRRAIESGEVTFSNQHWQEKTLEDLDDMKLWCISRQSWWGNPVLTAPKREVLSPWFSLAAWALDGAGWPDSNEPELIDEVFVNHRFLKRWIIPTQLVSILVTGNILFRQIHAYGSLRIAERQLKPRKGVPANALDEERFVVEQGWSQMRGDTGNVIQPKTLISRFGADALRLGYVLCCNFSQQRTMQQTVHKELTLSEASLRQARKALKTLTAKVTGIYNLARNADTKTEARLLDSWIISSCLEAKSIAEKAYGEHKLFDAGITLINTIKDFVHYADTVAQRSHDNLGPVRATMAMAIKIMANAFSPICPFTFDKLVSWTEANTPDNEKIPRSEAWLERLIKLLSKYKGSLEICSPDPILLKRFNLDLKELENVTRAKITPTSVPSIGSVECLDRCLLIIPGALKLPAEENDLLLWYRDLCSITS